jgi:kynurenine formamidase
LAGAISSTLPLSGRPARETPIGTRSLTKADFDHMMIELSNWGRWGKDDQKGTINLITADKRKHAASLVREGTSISLAHNLDRQKSVDNPTPLIQVLDRFGVRDQPEIGFDMDTYTMTYHGTFYSHMDALCHVFYESKMYNGFPAGLVTSGGSPNLDITAFKDGIVTRGVLLDVPSLKGVPYLEPETQIYPEDLDGCEKQARTKVTTGDMVFIRTGRWARRSEKGPWDLHQRTAGLFPTCARWLKQRDVAVLASDVLSDQYPSPIKGVVDPVHGLMIVALGTPLFDNLDLEELTATAKRLQRWEFMVTAAPLRIPGGTGSPVNPLAIF